jgi:predicted transcriptional regulator
MAKRSRRFRVDRLRRDMDRLGWNGSELSRQSDVPSATLFRFLTGQVQTARTLKKLADALGHPPERYINGAQS